MPNAKRPEPPPPNVPQQPHTSGELDSESSDVSYEGTHTQAEGEREEGEEAPRQEAAPDAERRGRS